MRALRRSLYGTAAAIALLLAAGAAEAATIKVKCEVRADRSRASVDGNDLAPGSYTARLMSGGNTAVSAPITVVAPADEAQFDFDSAADDIAAGATSIGSGFIIGGSVSAAILNAAGSVVASNPGEACRLH